MICAFATPEGQYILSELEYKIDECLKIKDHMKNATFSHFPLDSTSHLCM